MIHVGANPPLSSEAEILFNPAFCAVLLNKSIGTFEAHSGNPLPFVYAYLILPLALHSHTRQSLPQRTTSSMWAWVRDNPEILMDFPERVQELRPVVGAAILFAIRQSSLKVRGAGLSSKKLKRQPQSLRPTDDWRSCVNSSEFLGRWFASAKVDEQTLLAKWGLRP